MVDANKKNINVGDDVYFTYYGNDDIYKGRVIEFKKQRIYIQPDSLPWDKSPKIMSMKDHYSGRIVKL